MKIVFEKKRIEILKDIQKNIEIKIKEILKNEITNFIYAMILHLEDDYKEIFMYEYLNGYLFEIDYWKDCT